MNGEIIRKNPSHDEKGVLQKLPLALTGGFCLFLTLDAGLLIMLALAHFLENATAGALPLKPFERTFQGLIFADTYLGHCYPSPRSYNGLASSRPDGRTAKPWNYYTAKCRMRQRLLQISNYTAIFPSCSAAAASGHIFLQLPSAKDMEMQMENRLAGMRSAV